MVDNIEVTKNLMLHITKASLELTVIGLTKLGYSAGKEMVKYFSFVFYHNWGLRIEAMDWLPACSDLEFNNSSRWCQEENRTVLLLVFV